MDIAENIFEIDLGEKLNEKDNFQKSKKEARFKKIEGREYTCYLAISSCNKFLYKRYVKKFR